MCLLFHWLSPLSPHLIYGIRCLPQERRQQQQRQAASCKILHIFGTRLQQQDKKKTTTMEMTSAIAAAVCSAGPKNGSVVRSLRLGGWGDGLKSLTLTMKFATMPRVC